MTTTFVVPTINYRLHASLTHAMAIAQDTADANGSPVAILSRDRWYRVVECPDLMDALIETEHWQLEALCDPDLDAR